MDIDDLFEFFFSNPSLLQIALLIGVFACALSPRILIIAGGSFLGGVCALVAAAALWRAPGPALFFSLGGASGGLFIAWRLARRVRWFWFTGARRRIVHSVLGSFLVVAIIWRLFAPQIEDYMLMRRLIGANQPDRLTILEQGDIPTMDDVPFLLDRLGTNERSAVFRAMLDGSGSWKLKSRPGYADLIHWAVDKKDRPLVVVALNWLKENGHSYASWLAEQSWSQDELRLLIESGLDVLGKDKSDVVFAERLIAQNSSIAQLFWVLMETTPNLPEIITSDSRRTYLELLAYQDQNLILAGLQKSGTDLAARDRSGRTLLHHLAMGSVGASSVLLLVQQGIDVNAPDNFGVTAIHHASYNNPELAKRFLSASCPINAPNKRGETPLFLAVDLKGNIPAFNLPDTQRWLQGDNHAGIKIALALMDAGVNPCLTDLWGNSALHYALMHNGNRRLPTDVIEMLLEQGANPLIANKKGSTPRGVLTPHLHDSSNYYGPSDDIRTMIDALKKAEEDLGALDKQDMGKQ